MELIGIDHPIITRLFNRWRRTNPEEIGAVANMGLGQDVILTQWLIQAFGKGADSATYIIPLALDLEGKRVPTIEKRFRDCFAGEPSKSSFDTNERQRLLSDLVNPADRN